MRSTEQVVGLDFRITPLSSCSDIGQTGSVSLAGAATTIIFVATKVCLQRQNVCRDNNKKVAINTCLSRQMFCRDKHTFVPIKVSLSRQTLFYFFSCDKYLSRQKYFVAASILLSRQKPCFVETNTCLSRQNFCCDKNNTCGSSRQ